MNYGKRKELLYRCIQIGAWAQYVPPKNQNQRELLIAINKLQRLMWQDEFHFMLVLDSVKRSQRLGQKKSKMMGLQYEKILKLVAQSMHDTARKSGKTLSAAEVDDLMYGEKGLITEANAYGKIHAGK